ncbi:MAG TPA: DNA-binding response regulator [Desulfobacteraceae bacterium]|nr:DNA-binding response regulator [Desulfobacteraceae bacterium]
MRLLIIEDNPAIVENITDFMAAKGFILDFAMDGIGGLHLALTQTYDVIVLDLMLPGMDGITLCRKLRQEADRQVPVIMLTARDTLDDKLLGFDSGADDYLVKPFALKELEARVRALAKRKFRDKKTLSLGDLTMDLGTFEVTRRGNALELNNTCISILRMLMEASPNVVSRKEMEHVLWGDMPPGSDVLRSHLYNLRKKVDKPFDRALIHTVHGVGFKLVPDTGSKDESKT